MRPESDSNGSFSASQEIGVGGEPLLVGGRDFGGDPSAVGQHHSPCPALLDETSPIDQVGRRHGALLLADGESDLPVRTDGR